MLSSRRGSATASSGASSSRLRLSVRSLMGTMSPRASSASPRTSPPSSPGTTPAGAFSFTCPLGSLSAEEVELARKNFTTFDFDGDGVISRADFGMAMARHDSAWLSGDKRAQLDAMYRSVDQGGTGAVTFEQFCVMRVRKKVAAGRTARAWGAEAAAPPPRLGVVPPLLLPAGEGKAAPAPPSGFFAAELRRAYEALYPQGTGWLPSRQLYDLLCSVAQAHALPLSAAQAAELARETDSGNGWSDLRALLQREELSRLFASPRDGPPPPQLPWPSSSRKTGIDKENSLQTPRKPGDTWRAEPRAATSRDAAAHEAAVAALQASQAKAMDALLKEVRALRSTARGTPAEQLAAAKADERVRRLAAEHKAALAALRAEQRQPEASGGEARGASGGFSLSLSTGGASARPAGAASLAPSTSRMTRAQLEQELLSTQRSGRATTRADAARQRYDALTPRAGAKAAQREQIEALMAEAAAEEEGWTPRPAQRIAAAAPPPPAASASSSSAAATAAASASAAAVEEATAELHGLSPAEARARVRALQRQAAEAARASVGAGGEARRALQRGELAAATRHAAEAEEHATEARATRRLAAALYAALRTLKAEGVAGAATPRGGASLDDPSTSASEVFEMPADLRAALAAPADDFEV